MSPSHPTPTGLWHRNTREYSCVFAWKNWKGKKKPWELYYLCLVYEQCLRTETDTLTEESWLDHVSVEFDSVGKLRWCKEQTSSQTPKKQADEWLQSFLIELMHKHHFIFMPQWLTGSSQNSCYPRLPFLSGQFLLEQSRLGEAAEMAERAAELDNSEFDVVFSAAHMLRLARIPTWKQHSFQVGIPLLVLIIEWVDISRNDGVCRRAASAFAGFVLLPLAT